MWDSLRWPRDTLYPLKLALTSPTSGGLSVGIILLRTKAMEFVCFMTDIISSQNIDLISWDTLYN
jgi:hypothetical protein